MPSNSRFLALASIAVLGSLLSLTPLLANDIAEIPEFMGDWSGEWTNPKGGYYRNSFKLMARVVGKGDDTYEVQFVEEYDKLFGPISSLPHALRGTSCFCNQAIGKPPSATASAQAREFPSPES